MRALVLRAPRTRRVTIGLVIGFAAVLALASQVAIPIPGSPVPITLQPLIVVLAGLWLGPAAGAASMVLYLMAGAAGLPVFSPFGAPGILRLIGPTGGYLLAFPAVAAVTGWLSGRRGDFAGRTLASIAGLVVLFAGGIAQLAILNGSFATAFAIGLTPFAGLDIVKAVIAAALAPKREGHEELLDGA
jgi:biotin transport system substrate-specific component